jgi:xanthine/uracil/vitamin C permease (AzgA family)
MSDTSTTRAERAANLFDLRRIIGGVFVAWGVLLTVLGLTESDAEVDKAAGININLYAGIGMLVVGIIFLLWAFTRPLGQEITESEEASASTRGDGEGTRRPGDAGRE